ncbi:diacylglycerol/lipid kinase family protein [Actinocatenispora rupis]|uniref:Sphingosine kinase n=1 Tax=Actinocatenispora rupis TaxID=519421 RepID=A0A8J3J4F9_9ACTN|nr:diacylglycerol kinase family protein [Actinocatenispora rupis]GID09957.1 sphingosine kinase [Actinocatenispora rupis]
MADEDPSRSALVVNPAKVDARRVRAEVTAVLAEAGRPAPDYRETTPDEPGGTLADAAVRDGARLVFVCGGDGTVRSCAGALAGTDVALCVLPGGTGNLLAANLGVPNGIAAAARLAVTGVRRRIDVGDVDGDVFTVMAGMGFDAHMLDATPEALKARVGWLAYLVGGARRLRDRPMRVMVRLDDAEPLRRRARSVLVANVGRLQGGLTLLPDAEPDDGTFDVAVVTPRSLADWLRLGAAVVRRAPRPPRMETYRCREVTVLSTQPQARELDGDVVSPGPRLHATLRPLALTVCVPAG